MKTDFTGKVLAAVSVVRHHGDLCVHDGKVYVAVNLTSFNRPCPPGKNFVCEYAPDFKFKRKILLPGWTKAGIQTACFAQDKWFFGTCGKSG